MRRKNHTHQQDIDDLKRQNALLEQQGISGGPSWWPPPHFLPQPQLLLASCWFSSLSFGHLVFSPRPGEGEGLHSAPGQLSVIWQQTVHQFQRHRRVSIRRGLRPQLRVWSRGASQQEEAAGGGQLEDFRALGAWPRPGQQGSSARRNAAEVHCLLPLS